MEKEQNSAINLEQKDFWEHAGEVGYDKAVFNSSIVAQHALEHVRQNGLKLIAEMEINAQGRVLELGCGDGLFASRDLAPRFKQVEAFDISDAAINRAKARNIPNIDFRVADITQIDLKTLGHYDAAFLMAILHHIKPLAPVIINRLAQVTDKIIILEPNGNNWGRKLVELTPRYRRAGEESFTSEELLAMFKANGFRPKIFKRFNFLPDITPAFLFPLLRWLEPYVEASSILNHLCTALLIGFEKERNS